MCRTTGITLLCLASTLSAQTQGSAGESPLRGQALVKAVIALARESEALFPEVEKIAEMETDGDRGLLFDLKCTTKKRDE